MFIEPHHNNPRKEFKRVLESAHQAKLIDEIQKLSILSILMSTPSQLELNLEGGKEVMTITIRKQ